MDRTALVDPATRQVGVGVSEDVPAVLGAGECVVGGGELEVAGGALSEDLLALQAALSTRRDPRVTATNALARPILITEP